MRKKLVLIAIVVGYLALSFAFHRASPPLEVSDEAGHMEYILRLKAEHRLPFADINEHTFIGIQELAQPPLYYLCGALLISLIDTSNHSEFFHFRPSAPVGRADLPGPMNMWELQGNRRFPYHQTMLAITVLRVFSMLLGAATIILTFKTAAALFPNAPDICAFSAALVAFNPMFLLIANSVNNDNMVSCLVAAGACLLASRINKPLRRFHYAELGAVASLSLLAKPSGLVLLPAAGIELLQQRLSLRRKAAAAVAFIGSAVLISGWWMALNMIRYRELLALGIHSAIARNGRPEADFFALLRPLEFSGFLKSYWGVFGAFDVIYPDWVYACFFWLSGALTALSIIYFVTSYRSLPSGLSLLAVISVTNFGALIWWTSRLMGSQGRLLFPSISAISICFAAGFLLFEGAVIPAAYIL